MKLTYRGVEYDYNPPQVDSGDTIANGLYRGASMRVRKLLSSITNHPSLGLKYRGAAYAVQAVETPEAASTVVPAAVAVSTEDKPVATALSTEARARSLTFNHHRLIKQRQQTMLSRFAVEVGMSAEDASHYWNPIQGKVNDVVWDKYDRSHVAFS